jgi:hypothetical protein
MVPERIKGSRRTAAVPSWRYRDLQQRAAAGLAIGGRPLCPFYLGGRGGRLRHGLLSGCPSCGVPWSTGRMFRQEIGMRSNHRRRAVLDLSQSNCDSRASLTNNSLALSSTAEPSMVSPAMMPASSISSLAWQAYFSLASLRCLSAVLQPACFALLGLSESMRAL